MLLAATPSQFNDAPIRPIFTLETLETKKLQHTNQDRIKAFFEAGDLLPTYPAPHVVRRLNASIPFAVLGSDRPRPLAMDVQSPEFAKALDCMASALFYEAGESRTDQAAVAQVVMNRLRHPAFPHSICAVVYQGAERETGCQFTFTCDGSLRRAPSSAAWQAARATAKAFLTGETYPGIGMATHYHTDWVHPYWSSKLDKVAQVGPHLFFRWHGPWGSAAAFTSRYAETEPVELKLAFLSSAHHRPERKIGGQAVPVIDIATSQSAETLASLEGEHFILIDGGSDGTSLAMLSLGKCRGSRYCKVVGWDQRSAQFGSPDRPVIRTVAFLFISDKRTGVEIVLWDCTRFNRPTEAQCLSDGNRHWVTFHGNLSHVS